MFFGDIDADGHLDILSSEGDLQISWLRNDGTGGFNSEDTTAITDALEDLCTSGEAALGFDSESDRSLFQASALPTAGGDRLLAGVQLRDTSSSTWGVAFGVLESDGSGGWTATLLQSDSSWGGVLALADIDGNGVGEVLVDAGGRLTLYWDGELSGEDVLGEVTDASVYPTAWTTAVDGSELGFVLGSNWAFGFTEAWSWTPSQGLERIATDFYMSEVATEVRPGFEASEFWLHDRRVVLEFTPGSPASLTASSPSLLSSGGNLASGNFDGSGRMSIVTEGTQALRVASDGSLETLPLTLSGLSYDTIAVDINGDGLDDLLNVGWSSGIEWMENISAATP
ncbi:MAG: hypothetical protein CMJ34_13325 [Phycisphaerae bacterium]|nr:hypothetical protein [Phycisphaerae bacterium]